MAFTLLVHTIKNGGRFGVTTDEIETPSSVTLLIAVQSWYSVFDVTLSDSKTNTWSHRTIKQHAGQSTSKISYCVNPTVGSGHTFSFTGGDNYGSLAVLGFSGNAVVPYDVENGATGTGTTLQTGSVTPSEADELLIAGLSFYPAGTISIDSGMTISDQCDYAAGMGLAAAYLIQGAAGALNPTWTSTTSMTAAAATIATFKAAAGGGTVRTPRRMLSGVGA